MVHTGEPRELRAPAGRWDEALRIVDLFADAPDGAYLARVLVQCTRAHILDARDRTVEAMEAVEAVLAHLQSIGDVQVMWPALCIYIRFARRLGRSANADSALTE